MHLVYENEMRLIRTCLRMEEAGIRLDVAYTLKALELENSLIQQGIRKFKELTGREYQDSNKLFAEVFKASGDVFPTTLKGNPSFNADSLETINTPVANVIKRIREHEKRAGTYYSSFLHYVAADGRIHAIINQAGTTTGRFSYSNPNLQNIPKEDDKEDLEKEFVVRGCFVTDPGFSFVSLDYSQVEYRLMLDYAGETEIIRQVNEGADLHQAMADMVGISRKYAKTLNFACLYGSGVANIAYMLDITEREAKQLRDTYFRRLPKVSKFIKKVMKVGEYRGYVRNWLGRECHINHRDYAYKLPNHLIQGGAADVIKVAMNKIDDLLIDKRSQMLVQIHDDILHSVHENEMDLIPQIKEIMESVYTPKNGMRLTVSPEISTKSWAYRDFAKLQC